MILILKFKFKPINLFYKRNEPGVPIVKKWNDQEHSFASSVFNDSTLNDMMSSLGTHVLESKNIPIQNEKALAGSLVTATSLDNNNNLINDLNEKKVSLDFIDHNQDEENFFSEFDDINFESINELNLMKGNLVMIFFDTICITIFLAIYIQVFY